MTTDEQQNISAPSELPNSSKYFELPRFDRKLIDLEKKITLFLNADMADDCKRMVLSILMDYKASLMEHQRKNCANLT